MIYTKTGDNGTTSLASGQRVPKTDVRIEAYGTVDELNSWIGTLRAEIQKSDGSAHSLQPELEWIQNKLFNLGALLSDAPGEWITAVDAEQIEHWIDAMQEELPKQHAFLLPAGSEAVTRCHICRTVCRRAERRMIEAEPDQTALKFINRLSDYLFVLSRFIATKNGEIELAWRKN